MNKEQRTKAKEKLGGELSVTIAAIEGRIAQRTKTCEVENLKDQDKLDELKLQLEAVTGLK